LLTFLFQFGFGLAYFMQINPTKNKKIKLKELSCEDQLLVTGGGDASSTNLCPSIQERCPLTSAAAASAQSQSQAAIGQWGQWSENFP
jgi:hypothetical protein